MPKFDVMRLTQPAYDTLRELATTQPELWLDHNADFGVLLEQQNISDYAEKTGVVGDKDLVLEPAINEPANRRHKADNQALKFYDSLQGVTPALATDNNMWTWMNHFLLHSYNIHRWAEGRNSISSNFIHQHWFIENQRHALVRNTAAGRTWWIAHVAKTAAKHSYGAFTEQDAIQLFANSPRYYHNCMDSRITRNPLILSEVVRSLLTDAVGIKATSSDEIWKYLNLSAGTIVLDAMPRDLLRNYISEFVDNLMADVKHVVDRNKLRNRKPFRVLSLGAGVQSTVLALMADRGEFGLPKPDIAIFADTGWEPKSVYENLDWLEKNVTYDIVRVNNGNIRESILAGVLPDKSSHLGIPAFVRNSDGSNGILMRQCTTHFKMKPIHQYLRRCLNFLPGKRAPKNQQVEMWLGISIDEAARQKSSQEEWITKRYPLIENNLSRAQLQEWFHTNFPGRKLPKSSCIGCPYHGDSMWKSLKEDSPSEFQDAVFVDAEIRNSLAIRNLVEGEVYLHRSRVPLSEIEFGNVTSYDDAMTEECEGVCGV